MGKISKIAFGLKIIPGFNVSGFIWNKSHPKEKLTNPEIVYLNNYKQKETTPQKKIRPPIKRPC
jgi:hypothetical protein